MPQVSLVIPAYNEAKFLPRLLDSIDAARDRTRLEKPDAMMSAGEIACTHSMSLSLYWFRLPGMGSLPATPMLATVSPFVIEGTARINKTTPATGARASKIVLPT